MRKWLRKLLWIGAFACVGALIARHRQVVTWGLRLTREPLSGNVLYANIKELFWPVASSILVLGFLGGRLWHQRTSRKDIQEHTRQEIDYYNNEVRPALFAFKQRFDTAISDAEYHEFGREYFEDETLQLLQVTVATESDAARLIHAVDTLGWSLAQKDYANNQELLTATTSELRRVLLDAKYASGLNQVLAGSSVVNYYVVMGLIQTNGGHNDERLP